MFFKNRKTYRNKNKLQSKRKPKNSIHRMNDLIGLQKV